MKWITATDLENWTKRVDARATFPVMIADLIRAAAEVQQYRFPSGNKGQIRGFDGVLEAKSIGPFVPDGASIWEFGVTGDYLQKANDDYQKRLTEVGQADRAIRTFVFATPHAWDRPKLKIEDWIRARSGDGWKAVRIIDGIELESWLDASPAVAARYARYELNLAPQVGAHSTDEFWEEYSNRSRPCLTEDVLLCQRDSEAKRLLELLRAGPSEIVFRADSPDEVIAFAVAAIRRSDTELRFHLEARTVIVDTPDAGRRLMNKPGLIYIPRAAATSISGLLTTKGATLVAIGRDTVKRPSSTSLPRPAYHTFGKAIATMGIQETRAEQLARESGRSVTILTRRIPNGAISPPEWSSHGLLLLPAMLAGAWDTRFGGDQAALEALAAQKYVDYEQSLGPLTRLPDPPLDREGTVLAMRAPVDAFAHLGNLITAGQLNRLGEVASTVFGTVDPTLDRPESEFLSLSDDDRTGHSKWLRNGLATTLLHLAVLGAEADVPGGADHARAFVNNLVAKLPGLSTNYRLIASLRDELSLLMEAAPDPLLSALEQLLGGNANALLPVFREEGFLGPSSPHTSVLWGLETLAWDPTLFERASMILAGLAQVDPGGQLMNRPINSLREIFLPWLPSTNASLVHRLRVLDRILTELPAVGWNLLLQLLPERSGFSHSTSKPLLRESGASDREQVTNRLVYDTYNAVIERALRHAGNDPSRLAVIVKSSRNFTPTMRQALLATLETFFTNADADSMFSVWSALKDELNENLAFQDAAWALDTKALQSLSVLVQKFEPSDSVRRNVWLFNEHFPDFPDKATSGRAGVEALRRDAVRAILSEGGHEGIFRLVDSCELPPFVAISVAAEATDLGALEAIVDDALKRSDKNRHFAAVLSHQAERLDPHGWAQRLLDRQRQNPRTADDTVALLRAMSDNPTTWDLAEALGQEVSLRYWRTKASWPLDANSEVLERAAREYINAGRAIAGIDALHDKISSVNADTILKLLDLAASEISSMDRQLPNTLSYQIADFLDELIKRSDVSREAIAAKEFLFMRLLRRRKGGWALHKLMAQRPSWFVDLISMVFNPKAGRPDKPTDNEVAKGRVAFQVLMSLHEVPGVQGNLVDEATMKRWITVALELATKADRREITELYAGNLFAHAPKDASDHAWPHVAVRNLIEEIRSDEFERGIRIEIFNMRGTVTKALHEGGKQERELAEQARSWQAVARAWPRTSLMLGLIAKEWDASADHADQLARQEMMRS